MPSTRGGFVPGKGKQARKWSRGAGGLSGSWLHPEHQGQKVPGLLARLPLPAPGARVRRKHVDTSLLRRELI